MVIRGMSGGGALAHIAVEDGSVALLVRLRLHVRDAHVGPLYWRSPGVPTMFSGLVAGSANHLHLQEPA